MNLFKFLKIARLQIMKIKHLNQEIEALNLKRKDLRKDISAHQKEVGRLKNDILMIMQDRDFFKNSLEAKMETMQLLVNENRMLKAKLKLAQMGSLPPEQECPNQIEHLKNGFTMLGGGQK